ncbi:MAG TPA: hypothetical protein PLG19_04245 [Bacteroidales bacterium]|nr:hypothetical protein [Bacteroidales bacterium]HOF80787.1 hypothetical protein [Bacteroidales bacterium]
MSFHPALSYLNNNNYIPFKRLPNGIRLSYNAFFSITSLDLEINPNTTKGGVSQVTNCCASTSPGNHVTFDGC